MVRRRRSETDLGNKYVLQMRSRYFLVVFRATLLILDTILVPADFEGCPEIEFFGIDSNKMRKNGALDRVLKKHEFHWTLDAKIQRPEMVKNEFGR